MFIYPSSEFLRARCPQKHGGAQEEAGAVQYLDYEIQPSQRPMLSQMTSASAQWAGA